MQRSSLRRIVPVVLLAALISVPALAEDVEKKWRIGGTIGGFSPQDSITSDSANTLTLVDEDLVFQRFFIDPRNDNAIFGELDMQPGEMATFSAQYAISKIFLIEASVGYGTHEIGDVEVQAQFAGEIIPQFESFLFRIYRVTVGDVERIPVNLTAIARFRPRSSFNPYVGVGIGYTFHGFDVSDEFNQLSQRMDGSFGGFARVTEATVGNPRFASVGNFNDLTGATVRVDDTFAWHAVAGAEYSFKRKWAIVMDVRASLSAESVHVQFNGADDLGVAVPERVDFVDSPLGSAVFGGVLIPSGGLIDGGQLVPLAAAPPNTDCSTDPQSCFFDATMPDGLPDPGIYYAQGGQFDYGGIGLTIGIRYTF